MRPFVVTHSEPAWFLGTLVRPKLTGAQTGGRFALWELVLPHGAAPPLHTHPQDETFYVLDGDLVAYADTETARCGPGAVVFVPGGVPHAFRVESDSARVLFLSTPAGIEEFVRDLSEPARYPWLPPPPDGPRVTAERMEEANRAHGVVNVGAPPA